MATRCLAAGDGLTHAICGEATTFTIQACNEQGTRCTTGGDAFLVFIRGRGVRVRARLTDHRNGEYTVRFVPTVTGVYSIIISLLGTEMAGCPFQCHVTTVTPHAANCTVAGAALSQVIARVQHSFDIRFRDKYGRVAHSEDLDVYVERVVEDGTAMDATAEAPAPEPSLPTCDAPVKVTTQTDSDLRDGVGPPVVPAIEIMSVPTRSGDASLPTPPTPAPGAPPAPKTFALGKVERKHSAAECIVTSKSPLVVRRGISLDSEKVGQLRPGRKVHVLEFRHFEAEGTRALVALDEDEPLHRTEHTGNLEEKWRNLYGERPIWWDEITSDQKVRLGDGLIARSPRRVPIGWVTIVKGGRALVAPRMSLHAGDRQLHIRAWARQLAVDKSHAARSSWGKNSDAKDLQTLGHVKATRASRLVVPRHDQSIFKNEVLVAQHTTLDHCMARCSPHSAH